MSKHLKLFSKTVLILIFLRTTTTFAGTIDYPSQLQPGTASISTITAGWKFSNNLFSATFIQNGGKLYFGGSNEMNLASGTEIFQIVLGNGTKVNASQMTWGEVKSADLIGTSLAQKYSEQLNGKALTATLTYNNMTFKWRALLRDGSHYLRTELEISTTANTPMTSITPMLYKVLNQNGKQAPVVVGNTRGAIVASDYLFAGVETPLAFNTVDVVTPKVPFNSTSWSVDSWLPASSIAPSAIVKLGFTSEQIVVSQGEVQISTAGSLAIKFQYSSGTHRMNLTGVDVMKDGIVVASDYHIGYTGSLAGNNIYTLNIPSAGRYSLRYFGEVKTETITSAGTITLTGPTVTIIPPYNPASWVPTNWLLATNVPAEITALGFSNANIGSIEGKALISKAGNMGITFQYTSGANRMNLTGVDILDNLGAVVASDYHIGSTGMSSGANSYTLNVPSAGVYTLRYFGDITSQPVNSTGTISFSNATVSIPPADSTVITGKWSRNTTLQTTDTFKVSSVIGMVADGQRRRSFLAYHERERAVPWRSFTLYNSWYELDININNNVDPLQRMTETMCLPVINSWKTNLYDAYGVGINAFVWDDGWDNFNSLWNFHIGFPNGFSTLNSKATQQGSGIGAWLGPVGGYGSAKSQRLAYWNQTHDPDISNFQLSNKEYFDAFVGRCGQMVTDYDMRFFKFDGISTEFSATGPVNEEDAEGIINVLKALRKKRNDLFFNCTVGTWASPFWFHYADAVWRQENDFDQAGNQGNAREKWMTYRDRLVYQNFVTNSPLCPINSLMTHGLIVTKNGPPAAMPHDNSVATLNGIIREMRCAFACGSGMVELYVDNDLMTSIGNKALWKELASCITWHRNNKDVLADAHWVGGNPWDGTKVNVYGWASWNPSKSTLALRNPSGSASSFSTTLRKALDIPAYVTGSIRLQDAFTGQTQFAGITNAVVDIDATLTFSLPAFSVVVFNGAPASASAVNDAKDDTHCKAQIYSDKSNIVINNIGINSTIRVMDMKGSLVRNMNNNSTSAIIPISQVGTYIVEILNQRGTKIQTQKVICN